MRTYSNYLPREARLAHDEAMRAAISRLMPDDIDRIERDCIQLFEPLADPAEGRACDCEDAPCCGCYEF